MTRCHLERIIDKMFRQVFKLCDVEFPFAALAIDPPHRVAEPRKIVQDARAQMFHFEQVRAGDAAAHELDRTRGQRSARTAENLVVRHLVRAGPVAGTPSERNRATNLRAASTLAGDALANRGRLSSASGEKKVPPRFRPRTGIMTSIPSSSAR